MTVKFYTVGGCVRDEIMGLRPKDIDFSVEAPSFDAMRDEIVAAGMKIVVESPQFNTIRAVAKTPFMGHKGGLDFVVCRKDGPSSDGRRPDFTEAGTLMDDLARRDFTMNAIAKDEQGNLIDPFDGVQAIKERIILPVGSAHDRLFEDALRGLRALRFSVTKGFDIHFSIVNVLRHVAFADALASVSKERQREEMEKMFSHDTLQTLRVLEDFKRIRSVVFSDGLRLSATMAQ